MTEKQKLKLFLANKDKVKGRTIINNEVLEKKVIPDEVAAYIEQG